jgi:hypothetical protein
MSDDKYWPRSFTDDPGPDPVSLINEPVPPDNVSTLVRAKERPLHAVLCVADRAVYAPSGVVGPHALRVFESRY